MIGTFITILNMSMTASFVAAVVIVARLLLKKTPKIFSYALWAVVLFRMVCPVSFESIISLLPAKSETIPQDIMYSPAPEINSGITFVDEAVNRTINTVMPPVRREETETETYAEPELIVNPINIMMTAGTYIWMSGIVALIGYAFISYFKTKRRIFDATLVRDNIFESDRIKTPFVIGFIKPKIYIPTGITETEVDYVVKHEQTHIRRGDHFAKIFAFAALALHWFNPLMWLSYFLMAKDMELSCDESVMKRSPEDIRANYSNSLLSLSVKQSGLPTPLAFGESNVKARVKNVLRYKRPAFWISIVSVIAVLAVTIALAGNQRTAEAAAILSAQDILDETKTISPETISVTSPFQSGESVEYIAAKNDNITIKINPACESQWKGFTNGSNISHTINSQVPTADGIEIYLPDGTVIKTHDTVKINNKTIIIAGDTKFNINGDIITEGSGKYTIIDKNGIKKDIHGGNQSTYTGDNPDGDANKNYGESGLKGIIDLLPYMSQSAIDGIARKEYERVGKLNKLNESILFAMSESLLDELALEEVGKNGIKSIPDNVLVFMSQSAIDDLARKEYEKNGIKNISGLAWAVSESVIDELARKEAEKNGFKNINEFAWAISENVLDELVKKEAEKNGLKSISGIMWAVSEETVNELALKEVEKSGIKSIPSEVLVFMSQSVIDELAKKEYEKNGLKNIPSLAWNLSQNVIDEFVKKEYEKNGFKNIPGDIFVWMSQSTIDEIAKKEYEKSGLKEITTIAWAISDKLLEEIAEKEYERTGQDPKINTNIGRVTNMNGNNYTIVETPFIGEKKYLSVNNSKANETTAKLGKDGTFAEIYVKNSGKSNSEASVTVKDGNKSAVVKKDKDGTVSVSVEKNGKAETTVINPETKQDMTVVLNGKTVEISQAVKGGTAYITVKEGDVATRIKVTKNAQVSFTKYFENVVQIAPSFSS